MPGKTKIEWATHSWNPVTGCSHVSEGCRFCYAERDSRRWGHSRLPWTKENASKNIVLHPERLDQPFRWKRPRKIFVNSVSDLFHEEVPKEFVAEVFAMMAICHWHIFQVLTKREKRMYQLLSNPDFRESIESFMMMFLDEYGDKLNRKKDDFIAIAPDLTDDSDWPLKNVWLGVSCEDQKNAEKRIPLLKETPAHVRWISAEPLLGEIYFNLCEDTGDEYGDGAIYHNLLSGERWMKDGFEKELEPTNKIDWVVVGGESGHQARPMHPNWARLIRDQCIRAGTPFFFKQHGEFVWRKTLGESTGKKHIFDDGVFVNRVGKKEAGRILDGRTWDEYPTP